MKQNIPTCSCGWELPGVVVDLSLCKHETPESLIVRIKCPRCMKRYKKTIGRNATPYEETPN